MTLFLNDLNLNIQGDVLSDAYSLGMYATDASLYQITPIAVVLPKDSEDVQTAIKIARDHKISILPRGGGTSLAGQTVGQSLIIDFSKYMDAILAFNKTEKWVRVQPGIARDELNLFLKEHGLIFAPDPATSSRANVGGMVGNNSSGTKSILYGKTVDHVLEVKAFLADGTALNTQELSNNTYKTIASQNDREGFLYKNIQALIQQNKIIIEERFPKVMRRVGGYNLDEFIHTDQWNLSKLLCGSEGTLAVMTEIKLNLVELPKYKSVCVAHFDSVSNCIRAVKPMLDFQPAAVEILDKTVLALSRQNLETKRHCHFIQGEPAAILLVEFYGDTAEEVLERPKKMAARLRDLGFGYAYPIYPEGSEYRDVWLIRKKGLGLMLGIKGLKKPVAFIEDAAIPIEHLPEYLEQVLAICAKYETKAAAYAHASVGVIHVRPILDMRDAVDIERMKNIAAETLELVIKYGGSWSGEHGDGLVRSPFNEQFFGKEVYQLLKQVKAIFDPENLMNPGKIVDSPAMDQNLRYGTSYAEAPLKTVFQFRRDGHFSSAVHMCNGVGECRKLNGGTMCPSFRATRDEEHSTRGRANALRLAISGQMGEDALTSDRMREVMDLCISCKACKSECPSNVDMSKLKGEVSQRYYDRHGVSLRNKMIAGSSELAARFAGPLAPLVNWVQESRPFRFFLEKMVHIDRRRLLPAYAREPFYKWFAKNYRPTSSKQQVVLFADTYLNYHEPQIGISALELLTACGYDVVLANVGCCQRPRISNGFLREAKKRGTEVANRLDVYLQKGLSIVVCEPSCASSLTDDIPDLLEDEALAKRMQQQIVMIDVFLEKHLKKGKLRVKAAYKDAPILVHGHCHQKSLYGIDALVSVLETAEGKVQKIDSGCCGMAGSFGYEKEHYALSKKMGEQVLFPTLAEEKGETVVACGFSCRHQIGHFAGREALHFVEVLEGDKSCLFDNALV